MKNLLHISSLLFVVLILAGCGTPNPLDYAVTSRDTDVLETTAELAGLALPTSRKTMRIAVFPGDRKLLEDESDDPELKKGYFKDVNKPREANKVERRITRAFDSQLETLLIQTPNFRMAAKADVMAALKRFEDFSNDKAVASTTIPNADFLFIFDVASYYMDLEETTTNYLTPGAAQAEGKYAAVTEFKISIFNLAEKRKVAVKLISGRSSSTSPYGGLNAPESQRALVEASKDAARGLLYEFLMDYSPFGVTVTRGEGRFAMIDMGSDFGLRVGAKVEFYTIATSGDTKLKTPFAEGKVLKVEKDSAWVEVANYRKVGVKINNLVRKIARQHKAVPNENTPE